MRSPADMQIIQIEITNACTHYCSNCTRFCGLHKKSFFMEYDTFTKAVDSLKGYKGIVGIMGGEPTIHPKFGEFLEYYRAHVPEPRPRTLCRFPLPSFKDYVARMIYQRGRHRGIWSSFGKGYYKYFEQIQDIFPYQVLNDHSNVNLHQALLVARKEIGIPDDQWIKLRDRCWIQNLWSASITPKGAFFCEIAAALDMLFDGPGGWPIEPDWWRRKPHEFQDQLHWCELCSAALNVPSLPASQQTDMMSPEIFERVKSINGWKIQNGKYTVYDRNDYDPKARGHRYIPTWFLPGGSERERVDSKESTLFPMQLDICVRDDASSSTISEEQLRNLAFDDFAVFFREPGSFDPELIEIFRKRVFNPGFLYEIGNGVFVLNRRAEALRGRSRLDIDSGLFDQWPKNKISRLTRKELSGNTLKQRLQQILAVILHRGAFLLPE